MPQQAPGQSHREGLTLIQVIAKFGDEESAKRWFTERLWPQGPYCPRCGSFDVREVKHPSMTHRCRDCEGRGLFSLKTGTVMQSSKLNYRTWALAIYLLTTNLKGVSSLKLHRDLGVTQKTAWHLAHRIREAWGARETEAFGSAVEVDETYVGGKKRPGTSTWRGTVGKAVVAGVKERETGKVHARVVPNIKRATLHQFVREAVNEDVPVYTDELASYRGIPNPHETYAGRASGLLMRDAASSSVAVHPSTPQLSWLFPAPARQLAECPSSHSNRLNQPFYSNGVYRHRMRHAYSGAQLNSASIRRRYAVSTWHGARRT